MNGKGGWTEQPVILVEGEVPFFADHPEEYIAKLLELHDRSDLEPGLFWTFIGQFKDKIEFYWDTER